MRLLGAHYCCLPLILSFVLFSSLPCVLSHPSTSALQYIVTFLSYHPHAHHEVTLQTALALTPPTTWRLLHRKNIAATLPTDFIVVETADLTVVSLLESHSTIRRVIRQAEHNRFPQAIRLPTDVEEFDINLDDDHPPPHLTRHPFSSGDLWMRGYTGQGVSVAVFDTGLLPDHRHFPNLVSRTDWTGENTTTDHVGHGTFVAGIIAGHHPQCPGLAPGVRLHVFRVFTAAQVSYTSWFLDAFNYALHIGIDVLNLSIGGPDFADNPFTEKIDELAAHGVIAVSAIGNDGPLWGSLNNPGDMMPVVGVGGAEPDGHVASFSSRGMTTHELDHLHHTYGRVKPDVVAYARSLIGPSHRSADHCKRLSGTSVASPVVSGAIALLASTVPLSRRRRVVTPASVKRALIESAHRLPLSSVYEQGAGLLHIGDAFTEMQRIDREFLLAEKAALSPQLNFASRVLRSRDGPKAEGYDKESANREKNELADDEDDKETMLKETTAPAYHRNLASVSMEGVTETQLAGPRSIFFPAFYDLRTSECTYMWPHCAQPLFEGAMPVHLNVTILNPSGVHGHVESAMWIPARNGDYLRIKVTIPQRFWPWSAGMGIHISVEGIPTEEVNAEGVLQVRIISAHQNTYSDIQLPIKVTVAPPRPRKRRLLWDMYHSIRYPPGYVPRDSLGETKDMLDWLGDHPHTNFHAIFRELLLAGFSVDILDQPFSCLGADQLGQYGGIMIVDSEDFFSVNDTEVLQEVVNHRGVALIVAAEWYNLELMQSIRFEDDNTRSWWNPVMSGGNIPGLNTLLDRFGIAFGEEVLSGDVRTGSKPFRFESGVPIVKFPPGGELLYGSGFRRFEVDAGPSKSLLSSKPLSDVPILGLVKSGGGAVLAYGDTNCLDTAYSGEKCFSFFAEAVRHTINDCAGLGTCKKLLRGSVISAGGLTPSESASSTRRIARQFPAEVLGVFKPHSKYPLQWTCDIDGSCEIQTIVEGVSTCRVRSAFQTEPAVDAVSGQYSEVVLPQVRDAVPVGSESKYYSELSRVWRRDLRDANGSVIREVEGARLFGPMLLGLRMRSFWLILVGLCMMFASISLRRMGQRVSYGRRVKARGWKNSRGSVSSSLGRVGVGRDGVGSQTTSSLRSIQSSGTNFY